MADISITVTGFIPSANASLVSGIAGEAMTRGQTLYYYSTDGKYYLFDANVTTKDEFAGLCCGDAANGQPILVCTKDPLLAIGATLANGDNIWASATPGGVTKTATDLVTGWRIWHIGQANSTTTINYNAVKGGIK